MPRHRPRAWTSSPRCRSCAPPATTWHAPAAALDALVADNRDQLNGFVRDGLPQIELLLRDSRGRGPGDTRPVAQPARQSIAADLPAACQWHGDTAVSSVSGKTGKPGTAALRHQLIAMAMVSALLPLAGCSGGLQEQSAGSADLPVAAGRGAGCSGQRSPVAGTVQVMLPQASPGLATERIVVLRSGERLDYYSGARWAAAAPAMLQLLVIDALRASNRFAMVESDGGPFAADYVLSMELRHFEADYTAAGPPRCTWRWTRASDAAAGATSSSIQRRQPGQGRSRPHAGRGGGVPAGYRRGAGAARGAHLSACAAALIPPGTDGRPQPAALLEVR